MTASGCIVCWRHMVSSAMFLNPPAFSSTAAPDGLKRTGSMRKALLRVLAEARSFDQRASSARRSPQTSPRWREIRSQRSQLPLGLLGLLKLRPANSPTAWRL